MHKTGLVEKAEVYRLKDIEEFSAVPFEIEGTMEIIDLEDNQ